MHIFNLLLPGLVLAFLCHCPLLAQTTPYVSDDYWTEQYTVESGLPQNSVKEIVGGDNGQIWLICNSSLVEFDGSRFILWDKERIGNSTSKLYYLFKVPGSKNLFLSSANNELIEIDKHGPRLNSMQRIENMESGLSRQLGFVSDSLPFKFEYRISPHYHIRHKKVLAIPVSSQSVYLLKNDSILFSKNNHVQWRKKGLAMVKIYFYMEDHFYMWDGKGPMYRYGESGKMDTISTRGIREIFFNRVDGQVFMWHTDNSLYRFYADGSTKKLLTVKEEFDLESVLELDKGTLFLGSNTKGLLVCRKKKFRSLAAADARYGVYYALRNYSDSAVIAANRVVVYASGRTSPFGDKVDSTTLHMNCVAKDKRGRFYFNSYFDDHAMIGYNADGTHQTRTPVTVCMAISEDDKGILWVSDYKNNLFSFNGDSLVFESHIGCAVRIIHVISDNLLLLGTEKGIYVYNKKSKRKSILPFTHGLMVRGINSFSAHKVYITTGESGIYSLDMRAMHKIPLDRNKWLKTAHCVVRDNKGLLWISSNKGLFCIPEREWENASNQSPRLPYYYIGKDNGFATNEFNGGCYPCGTYLPNGDIAFPSMHGIVWFTPDSVNIRFPQSRPTLSKVFLNDSKFSVDGDTLLFDEDIQRLEFYLGVPFFGDAHNVYLEYRYGDKNSVGWLPLDINHPSIVFSSLNPGYTELEVRVRTGFGEKDYNSMSLVLYRKPKFWETLFIWPLLLLVVIGVIFVSVRLYTHRLQRRNIRLQTAIKAAEKNIRVNIDELSRTNERLEEKNRFNNWLISSILHDIKGPLRFLVEFGDLHEGTGPPDMTEVRFLRSVLSTSKKIYAYSDRLIQALLTQQDNSFTTERLHVEDIILDKVGQFHTILEKKRIKIVLDIEEKIVETSSIAFEIIIHNLLDNSIKNQQSGTIYVSFIKLHDKYILRVKDEGVGLSADMQQRLNHSSGELPNTSRGGLGLRLIFSMVKLTEGEIKFKNETVGLQVDVMWPIRPTGQPG